MNYKESASKLNEFNDFMDCIKLQLAFKKNGREADKATFGQFAQALLDLMPISFEIYGLKFNSNYK